MALLSRRPLPRLSGHRSTRYGREVPLQRRTVEHEFRALCATLPRAAGSPASSTWPPGSPSPYPVSAGSPSTRTAGSAASRPAPPRAAHRRLPRRRGPARRRPRLRPGPHRGHGRLLDVAETGGTAGATALLERWGLAWEPASPPPRPTVSGHARRRSAGRLALSSELLRSSADLIGIQGGAPRTRPPASEGGVSESRPYAARAAPYAPPCLARLDLGERLRPGHRRRGGVRAAG
jgi:hypothetical protein